jgi:hypothetical protein
MASISEIDSSVVTNFFIFQVGTGAGVGMWVWSFAPACLQPT